MRQKGTTIAVIVLSFVPVAAGIAQERERTIPEIAAEGRSGGVMVTTAPSGAPSLRDALDKVEIFARGTVGQPISYLSNDQQQVLTDFPLLNGVILHQVQAVGAVKSASLLPIVITQPGGTVNISGITHTEVKQGFPLLQPGIEGFFLLSRVGDQWRVVGEGLGLGAFQVAQGGGLVSLSGRKNLLEEYEGVPVAVASERMAAEAVAKRQQRP